MIKKKTQQNPTHTFWDTCLISENLNQFRFKNKTIICNNSIQIIFKILLICKSIYKND